MHTNVAKYEIAHHTCLFKAHSAIELDESKRGIIVHHKGLNDTNVYHIVVL